MTVLLRIAERVLNRPLLVHPDKLPLILGVLEGRIPLGDVSDFRRAADVNIDAMPSAAQAVMRGPSPGASRFVGEAMEDDPNVAGKKRPMPYRRTSDGVAVITVTGSLINRGAWLGSSSGETSYEGIKYQVGQAAADPRSKAILLDIESPGGEAVGVFEAAAAIRAAAGVKPVTAVINGMAASAAYALASGASRIMTIPTGLAGSIGVVMLHVDYSRFLDAKGVAPTLIFAGAHKVDANPFEPLPAGVRDDLQAEVDQYYALFVKTVAAGRKNLSAAAIRATEARMFIGAEAVKLGLADSVGSFEQALANLSRGISRTQSTQLRGAKMDTTEGAPVATAGNDFVALNDHKAGCAKARTDGKAEGVAEGGKAMQARIKAILECEHAQGRVDLANHLAFDTDMTTEAATALLAKAPAASAAAAPKTIEQRMGGQGTALAMGVPMGPSSATPKAAWDKVLGKLPKRTAA